MSTLFETMLSTLRLLGGLRSGAATAGSTTSLTDTTHRLEIADYWNGGTIWITSADEAAPEGEFSLINDFASGVFTFAALTAAVQAGDLYAASPGHFPYDVLMDAVNLAISQYRYPFIDTTLSVVADQTEYDLPAGVKQGHLLEVHVQNNVDSNDNRWRQVGEWWLQETAGGQVLIVPSGLTVGRTLRLTYDKVHDTFDAGSDEVYEVLEPKFVIYRAAEFMLLQQMYDGDEWPYLEERMNYFMAKADAYESEFSEKIKLSRRK
jgi:hypothetical protein